MTFKLTKKEWIYGGVGLFVFLVLISSTKKVTIKEIIDPQGNHLNFDYSMLPTQLQPPYRLAEGEETPRNIKKNLSLVGVNIKPRFDKY